MSITQLSRRGFLKFAGIATCGALVSIRMANYAVAKVKEIKDYMLDRINSVYQADAKFPARASQDNTQVQQMYAQYLEKPLSHKSEELLHTVWKDESAAYNELVKQGIFPNARDEEYPLGNPYPYEEK